MSDSLNTASALEQGLRHADSPATRAVLQNPELFAFLLSNFNNTVKLASGKPADMVIGLSNKALSTTKLAAKSSKASGLVVGTTVAQILLTTASLVTVVGQSPAGAAVSIGATFAKKTSLALGLAGGDDKRAKCLAAVTDLAAAGLTTTGFAMTSVSGIGAVLLAGSIAQLLLSGYQVHQACIAKR